MNVRIQVVIESEGGATTVQDVAVVTRTDLRPDTVGLRLDEAKDVLASVQRAVVVQQVAEYLARQVGCPSCGRPRYHKGEHTIVLRTLYGTLRLASPRLFHCACRPQPTRTFSPLADALPEHATSELVLLESECGALMPYGQAVRLLQKLLPLGRSLAREAVRVHLQRVAERLERALGDEQCMFVEGCPNEWAILPRPDLPLTVGLDGGFIHSSEQTSRKDGWFEAIVGKSMTVEGTAKYFGFVQNYDRKPKRRLFEVLLSQGMQMNQQVTFFSDGGDDVRDLPLYLNPQAEHWLDWFHIAMRTTVLRQQAKGLRSGDYLEPRAADATLESIKWYLWHGNVFRALQETETLTWDLECAEELSAAGRKLAKALDEFATYLRNNSASIPNYGERWHNGEVISTAFVESTVNTVISRRMVKKQQMRWSPRGVHLLLQIRTCVLNDELATKFGDWYPAMRPTVHTKMAA
jgi:hypothetical protein